MENLNEMNFIEKPKFDQKKLDYIFNKKEVYCNLYQILIKKELKLYQYPYSVDKNIEAGDLRIRDKLFKASQRQLKEIYGDCFISGDSLYSMKKVEEAKSVNCFIILKGKTEYKIDINKFENERIIKQEDIQKDPLAKQFIEMIIRDILRVNPKLEFYKNIFVMRDEKKKIETDRVSVTFYPGFTTSFVETDRGNFLNVTLKNKIIQNETILDYLRNYKYEKDPHLQKEIKDEIKGRTFKVSYAKRNYTIDDISFDKNPKNTDFNYEGKTVKLVDYYESTKKIKIKDLNQPLIIVKRKNSQGEPINLYFVPELCSLSGLEDSWTKDGQFMKELAHFTKLNPTDRVNKTDKFIELLNDNTKDEKSKISSKEKAELYGIDIIPMQDLFPAYYMKETNLVGGAGKVVKSNDKTFPVYEKCNMLKWLCFYEKSNYDDADKLFKNLQKSGKAFGLKIAEPEWIEMENRSSAQDWKDTADTYFGAGVKRKYDFVIFLLGKNDRIYGQLKKHSLCENGYVSQVVKARTLGKKGLLSVCSKILLQINSKLGGISYVISKVDPLIEKLNLMVVGVSSSHVKGKGTGVAMVSTINDSFTRFFNKEEIIDEENHKEQLQLCVSSFIENAVAFYKKENNNKTPGGIIIYRQGVSLQQKDFLKTEVKLIQDSCDAKGIKFYYILVNTKTNFKFFEKVSNKYSNPGPGLLVLEGVTNRSFYEFYIQPQEVTEGSATPTCFHVAFGNLNLPEIIPKFTYDLCHIYSNWQGTVRVPNVSKCAEKLSKMTAKYMNAELNNNLKFGQAYL